MKSTDATVPMPLALVVVVLFAGGIAWGVWTWQKHAPPVEVESPAAETVASR